VDSAFKMALKDHHMSLLKCSFCFLDLNLRSKLRSKLTHSGASLSELFLILISVLLLFSTLLLLNL
jgi:hypothetical protein